MNKVTLFLFVLIISIASCKHAVKIKTSDDVSSKPKISDEDSSKVDFSKLNITLVLAGLDAKGFANIGILRGLEKHHIFPSKIIATGMGSLTAALYCAEKNSFSLEWKHFKLTKKIYSDSSFFKANLGKVKPKTMLDFSKDNIPATRFSKLALPLTIVATDLKTGKPFQIERGYLPKAIYAGIAIPGIYEPIQYWGKQLVTGYLTSGLPIEIALSEEPDYVIAVDLENSDFRQNMTDSDDVILRATKIAGDRAYKMYKKNNNVFIIKPNLKSFSSKDFDNKRAIMNIGLHTVDNIVNELKKELAKVNRRK
jgi:NTE family protein